jgi:hypothetical protein
LRIAHHNFRSNDFLHNQPPVNAINLFLATNMAGNRFLT